MAARELRRGTEGIGGVGLDAGRYGPQAMVVLLRNIACSRLAESPELIPNAQPALNGFRSRGLIIT
jgi:hypothetical protein